MYVDRLVELLGELREDTPLAAGGGQGRSRLGEAPVAAPTLPQQRRLVLRFVLARVASMALLIGTAVFALVSTAINISALPRCYDRLLEMT